MRVLVLCDRGELGQPVELGAVMEITDRAGAEKANIAASQLLA